MTTTTHVCDRCRTPIEVDRCPITIHAGPFRTEQPIDACRGCCAAFLDWMAAGKPKPPVPESMRDVLDRTSEGAVRA